MKIKPEHKPVVLAFVGATVVSTICAWRDLDRRSDAEVRGSKKGWRVAMALNTGNSLAYWAFGRR